MDETADAVPVAGSLSTARSGEPLSWLVLTHHLPPEPAYFRVKVSRRLERFGAVALKNSVYVLPRSDEALEDFQWLLQEIEREGGQASLSEARFIDGVTDRRLVERFNESRDADYREVVASARSLLEEVAGAEPDARVPAGVGARLHRLSKRLQEVAAVDYFGAGDRAAAVHAVERARSVCMGDDAMTRQGRPARDVGQGRTWVTREGVREDRIASAWLIRRFIDPRARFKFVSGRGYTPEEGELRFDTFDGEFTHEGDLCTFEVLLDHFDLDRAPLIALGEIIHDIDCKDEKFGRPETAGVASMINGIVRKHTGDAARLERGAELMDGLYEHFRGEDG